MQPHFLFNSLNTIHAMLQINLPAADRALISLSDSYRFLTDRADAELIAFREEWEFLQSYLELTRLRFADTIDVQITFRGDMERDYDDLRVPPLILQPLVENAVQHGLRGRSGHGQLEISVRRRGPWLRFECLDNGVGLPEDFAQTGFRDGGTLANIRSRLRYHFARSKLLLANRPALSTEDTAGVRTLLCFRDARPPGQSA